MTRTASVARRRGSSLLFLLVMLAAAYLVWRFTPTLLRHAGLALQYSEAPRKAEVIVVLAGGAAGDRVFKAAELYKQGLAPHILLSGPVSAYDLTECDMAIPFLTRRGESTSMFECIPNQARNTVEEAQAMVGAMRSRNIHSFILVTSNFHTRRARRIYQTAASDLTFTTVASDPPDFTLAEWWKTREGRKMFLLEWAKTFAHWLHL